MPALYVCAGKVNSPPIHMSDKNHHITRTACIEATAKRHAALSSISKKHEPAKAQQVPGKKKKRQATKHTSFNTAIILPTRQAKNKGRQRLMRITKNQNQCIPSTTHRQKDTTTLTAIHSTMLIDALRILQQRKASAWISLRRLLACSVVQK